MLATDLGNNAERAGMIATFGDFHICVMIRRQTEAGRGIVGNIFRLQCDIVPRIIRCRRPFILGQCRRVFLTEQIFNDRRNFGNLVQPDKRVHLRHDARKVFGKALGKASGDDDFLLRTVRIFAAFVYRPENRIDRFLLGHINE